MIQPTKPHTWPLRLGRRDLRPNLYDLVVFILIAGVFVTLSPMACARWAALGSQLGAECAAIFVIFTGTGRSQSLRTVAERSRRRQPPFPAVVLLRRGR